MELRLGYKHTEVGQVPTDWVVLSIRAMEENNLLHLFRGKVISRKDIQNHPGEYPIYSSSVHRGGLFGRFGHFMFDEELITWSIDGGGHFFYRPRHKFSVTNVCGYMRVDTSRVDYRFAAAQLQQLHSRKLFDYQSKAHPSVIRGMYTVPLPSLPEQRAIAEALSDVDALLAEMGRLIDKKSDLKQAAMWQLLTGQTRLPGFQREWEVRRLGDHVRFLKNGVHSRADLSVEGALKYVHYGDIHSSTRVLLDPNLTIMPSLPSERGQALDRLQDGDVVFVDASEDLGGVGKSVEMTGLARTDVVAGLHTIPARFDKSVLADGFKAYLQFLPAFRDHLTRLAAGTKVYATNRAHVASAVIRLPDVAEQTAIATVFSDMDVELSALEARREKTHALKQAMMQELLTGRIRLVSPEGANA